jgi:lipopolysaccharide transport system permease protein
VTERWEFGPRYPGVAATAVEVWKHRWLVRLVASRAFRRMYRRTLLGWLWLVINPLVPLMIRVVIFGALLGVGSNGLPYFLFLLGGSIAWDLFAATLTQGTRALEMHRVLSDLIYYPRAILPIGNIAPALLELGIKLSVFLAALLYYVIHDGRLYVRSDAALLWGVCALGLALLFALAISLFTSVWGETTRDMRFALNQLTSVWYLLTPVLYPLSQVPKQYRAWIVWNPMAVIVETFKWGVFGVGEFDAVPFGVTAAAICALFVAGLVYFARTEARTIDAR